MTSIRASQFIVGLNKYLEAVSHGFSVGMRFRMRFEGEDSPERRFTGTIVGTGDISSQWPESKWRCLKVKNMLDFKDGKVFDTFHYLILTFVYILLSSRFNGMNQHPY